MLLYLVVHLATAFVVWQISKSFADPNERIAAIVYVPVLLILWVRLTRITIRVLAAFFRLRALGWELGAGDFWLRFWRFPRSRVNTLVAKADFAASPSYDENKSEFCNLLECLRVTRTSGRPKPWRPE